MRQRTAGVLAAVMTVACLAACGSGEDPSPAAVTIAPDASTDQLLLALNDCPAGTGDEPKDIPVAPTELLAEVEQWWRLVSVSSSDRTPEPAIPDPAIVTVQTGAGATLSNVSLDVYFDGVWPVVDWALANGTELWFGVQPAVAELPANMRVAVVILPDGRAMFVGGCMGQRLNVDVRSPLAAQADEVIRTEVRSADGDGDGIATAVPGWTAVNADEETAGEGDALLNPETYPIEELEALQDVAITYEFEGAATEGQVICTKNSIGWNDCVPAGVPEILGGYLAGDSLEFWLIDSTVPDSLTQPVALLGEIAIPRNLQNDDLEMNVQVTLDAPAGRGSDPGPVESGTIILMSLKPQDGVNGP